MIVITMIAVVLLMSSLSVIHLNVTDNGTPAIPRHRKTAFDYAIDYTMHMLSLITNQGKR